MTIGAIRTMLESTFPGLEIGINYGDDQIPTSDDMKTLRAIFLSNIERLMFLGYKACFWQPTAKTFRFQKKNCKK